MLRCSGTGFGVTFMDHEHLLQRLQAVLGEHRDAVACAYLFGSRARGQGRPASDVDVAVLFRQPQGRELLGPGVSLRADMEESLGLEVDLIDLQAAPVDLVHRVLRDGVLLMDAAPEQRIAFEVDARNRYFDLLPYLQEYRKGTPA